MNGHGWKEYLTFTKKERTGVIVLLALIMIIYAVPEFFPDGQSLKVYYHNDSLKASPNKIQQESLEGDEKIGGDESGKSQTGRNAILSAKFEFDPNTLNEDGWKQLGVPEKTVRTITNFRAKGGKFRQAEDLRRIYGLNKVLCEELIPFVRFEGNSSASSSNQRTKYVHEEENEYGAFKPTGNRKTNNRRSGSDSSLPRFKKYLGAIKPIEINSADSALWEQLPGIGGKLASRIVLFRDRLGGFYNVLQVAETFGLSDSTFKIILPYISCGEAALRKININESTAPELARHPYIRWTLANAIVNYRNQHGSFRSVSDLRSVAAIPADVLEKLEPYLNVK